jgi:hypothetical protein
LDEHRCRLLRRGISTPPVLNGYCGNYEVGMLNSVVDEPVFNYYNKFDLNLDSKASNAKILSIFLILFVISLTFI